MRQQNTYDDSCRIHVTGSESPALVDKEDALRIMQHAYHLDPDGHASRNTKVAHGEKRGGTVRMGQDVLQVSTDKFNNVVYLNKNKLDCRKRNLALVDNSVKGGTNKLSKNNTSGFKGVGYSKLVNKWVAYISPGGKRITLGTYADKVDAAKAYDAAALKYFGPLARTNKVMGLYD